MLLKELQNYNRPLFLCLSLKQVLWEKSVFCVYYLHNNITIC